MLMLVLVALGVMSITPKTAQGICSEPSSSTTTRWRCWLRTGATPSSLAPSLTAAQWWLASQMSSWSPVRTWSRGPDVLRFAGELFADKPVVGYESGASLLQAERNGFQTAGPLRVWINDGGAA